MWDLGAGSYRSSASSSRKCWKMPSSSSNSANSRKGEGAKREEGEDGGGRGGGFRVPDFGFEGKEGETTVMAATLAQN